MASEGRQSLESGIRPPTYTSEGHSSNSGSELSLVSAPSRPVTPEASETALCKSTESQTTTTPRALPVPQLMALTSQGYLLTYAGEPYPPKPNRPPESSVTSFTKTVTTKSSLLVKCHATNHVSIHRKSTQKRRLFFSRQSSSITGTFAIDSFLHIPPELLPALSPSETTRRNLKLEVDNGGIDVDIYLVAEGCGPRATMYLGLCGGGHNTFPVSARIHTPDSHRPAFHLRAVGVDGQVSLQLPRSFHGMIVITVNAGNLQNHIMLSRELLNSATILTESSQVRGYFVGEMGDWSKEGDKVDVIVDSGRCNLAFEGEKCRSLF